MMQHYPPEAPLTVANLRALRLFYAERNQRPPALLITPRQERYLLAELSPYWLDISRASRVVGIELHVPQPLSREAARVVEIEPRDLPRGFRVPDWATWFGDQRAPEAPEASIHLSWRR